MSRVIFQTYKDLGLIDDRISKLKDSRDNLEMVIFNLHRDIEMICDEVENLVIYRDELEKELRGKA